MMTKIHKYIRVDEKENTYFRPAKLVAYDKLPPAPPPPHHSTASTTT